MNGTQEITMIMARTTLKMTISKHGSSVDIIIGLSF